MDREARASGGSPLVGCSSAALRLGLLEAAGGGGTAIVYYDNVLVRRMP